MLVNVILSTAIVLASASDGCEKLGPKDGAPAFYFQNKCQAERALERGDFERAARHFEKADSARIHESPNYRLRPQWAYALCQVGDYKSAYEVLESFFLMARADLGELECPDDISDVPRNEHMQLACIGYGYILSAEGERALEKQVLEAEEIRRKCEADEHGRAEEGS